MPQARVGRAALRAGHAFPVQRAEGNLRQVGSSVGQAVDGAPQEGKLLLCSHGDAARAMVLRRAAF